MTLAPDLLRRRVDDLAARFADIAATRMAGIALCHPGLRVAAVGFEPHDGGALGVLVSPWFMNLVWLPLAPGAAAAAVGQTRPRAVGSVGLDFIGAHEDGVGGFESCSLFSPMFEFADQAAALATAAAVMAELRRPVAPPPPAPPLPARRGFLFGSGAARGA